MNPSKFLIDGIDRLGKSSLAQSILNELGYHLMVHYDKPKVLNYYSTNEFMDAKQEYQRNCNLHMFQLLETKIPLIVDRTHLGEMVYAPLYRGYSGDYVYELEKQLISTKLFSHKQDIKLILLTTSNLDMLTDDGQSFDFNKKGDEQEKFKEAFGRSNLNKVMIDVHDGQGNYRSYKDILEEALK